MSDEKLSRAEIGRRAMEKRWGPHRAARLAAGLPATVREERGRKPDRFSDPDVDAYWIAEADAAGLIPENAPSTARRRIAFRYAQAVTDELARRVRTDPSTRLSSTEERIAYYEAEVVRLTAVEAADLRRAAEHRRQREAAENMLADLHFLGDHA